MFSGATWGTRAPESTAHYSPQSAAKERQKTCLIFALNKSAPTALSSEAASDGGKLLVSKPALRLFVCRHQLAIFLAAFDSTETISSSAVIVETAVRTSPISAEGGLCDVLVLAVCVIGYHLAQPC